MALNMSRDGDDFSENISSSINNGSTAQQTGGYTLEDLMSIGHFVATPPLYDATTYILLAIGIPSNILSFLTSTKMRPVSSSILFISTLAVVDLLFILWDSLFWLLIPILKVQVSDHTCRIYFYFGTVLSQYSVWLMVGITAERFIAVWLPLRVATICTTKRAVTYCILSLAAILLLGIPLTYIPYSYKVPTGEWFCGYHPDYKTFISRWTFVDNSINFIIPLPILAFCNIMIVMGLRLSHKRKQKLTNQTDGTQDKNRGITIMLLTASVIAVVLLSPNMIFFLYARSTKWDYQATAEDYAAYAFLSAFVYFLSGMNHTLNFWLYVISGRRFRKVFLDFICCKSKKQKYKKPAVTTLTKLSASKSLEDKPTPVPVATISQEGSTCEPVPS